MNQVKNKKNQLIKIFFACVVGFINGFLGAGGGLLCVLVLEHIYKLETKKAHATTISIILPISIISSIVYIFKNKIDFWSISIVSIGVIIGGILGAIFLNKANGMFIKWLFIAILFIAGVRMVI